VVANEGFNYRVFCDDSRPETDDGRDDTPRPVGSLTRSHTSCLVRDRVGGAQVGRRRKCGEGRAGRLHVDMCRRPRAAR
jgi:hypothetical protein